MGQSLLVVASMSNNVLTVFDLATHETLRHVALPKRGPGTIFVSPDQTKLYCLASGGCAVIVLDVETWQPDRIVPLEGTIVDRGTAPPRGRNLWASVILQGHIHQIDTATGEVLRSFPKAGPAFTISDDEQTLFTLQMQTRREPPILRARSADTGAVIGEIEVPRMTGVPLGLWRVGTKVYWVEMARSGGVHVVDASDPTAMVHERRIGLGTAPLGVSVDADQRLWIPNSADGTVSVIDSASTEVVHTIDAGCYVGAVTHHGGRAYFNQTRRVGARGYWRSMWTTVPAPYLGVYITSTKGHPATRRFIDVPAEVVAYDAATFERVDRPAMPLPSIGFTATTIDRP